MVREGMSRRSLLAGGVGIVAAGIPAVSALAGEAGNGGNDVASIAWDKEADVVVVGFGFAGTSAALGAAAEGASVIVLEKSNENDCGGNSASCCGAGLNPDVNMLDVARGYIRFQTSPNVSDEEIAALVDETAGTRAWLTEIGAEFAEFSRDPSSGKPGGPLYWTAGYESFHEYFQGTGLGYGLHRGIKAIVEANENIEVLYETPGCKLIFDPATKEVFGVAALGANDEIIRIKAKRGVVLGCGGFENNVSMLNAYYPACVPFAAAGAPYNTGDGIVMLGEVGAKMRGFASIELICHGCKAASEEIGAFIGYNFYDTSIWSGAIMVNDQGKRFTNESATTSTKTTAMRPCHSKAQLEELAFSMETWRYDNLPMFLVTDDARVQAGPIFNSAAEGARETFAATRGWYTWSTDNSVEVEKGWIVKADTLEELAEKLGVDADGLVAQVERWNAAVDAGEDPEFGRTAGLAKIEVAPFYGTELNLGILNTQGGAVRDAEHRVIDVDGNVVPRLYEAGELGSTYDWLYMGAGNVPEALAGRFAGMHAAQLEAWA